MNLLSVFLVAAKRLWSNKILTLCSIVGLTTAVALMSSIPLYADAANFKVLQDKLAFDQQASEVTRPPYAFLYRYMGAWDKPVSLREFDPVDRYITDSVPGWIRLPVEEYVRYVKTNNMSLLPSAEGGYADANQPLGWVSLGFISDAERYVEVIEGEFPPAETSNAGHCGQSHVSFMKGCIWS